MYKLFKLNLNQMIKGFSFAVFALVISTFSMDASAKDGMIPIEKLVCYGQGSSFIYLHQGNFVALWFQ